MTYRAGLFDLDGTLLNTAELIARSYQHTFRECLGLEVGKRKILANIGLTLPAHLALYDPDPTVVERMVTVYRSFNLAHHDELARVFPGVKETLHALSEAGIPLAVVSSKIHSSVMRGLRLFDLDRYFRTLVCLEDTERHKPDPAPVVLALTRLRAAASEAVMVGDSPADLAAGREAGCATAAVAWSTAPSEALAAEAPDHLLQQMPELLSLFGLPAKIAFRKAGKFGTP